jgi:hypothetical protein
MNRLVAEHVRNPSIIAMAASSLNVIGRAGHITVPFIAVNRHRFVPNQYGISR